MANGKKDSGPSQNFRLDEFVSKVVSDPKQPPNSLLLIGYLGASSEDNHIRLYFDAQLSDYIEIPQSAMTPENFDTIIAIESLISVVAKAA